MIEYKDREKGTVKVINVTEARANFANILGDNGAHYVITKNNKPLRVIIDYSDFERLRRFPQTAAKNALADHASTTNTNTNNRELTKIEEEEFLQRNKKERNIVRGLIETNINLSQTETAKKKPKPIPKAAPKHGSFEDLLGNQVPDYFSEEVVYEEEFLPEPVLEDVMETQDEDYFTASDEIEIEEEPCSLGDYEIMETNDKDEILEIEEERQIISRSDSDHDFVISPEIDLDPERQESQELQSPQAPKRSPEEEEYFNKYKKLYEGFAGEANQAKKTPAYLSEDDDVLISEKRKMLERRKAQQESFVAERKNTREYKQSDAEPPSLKDLLMDLESEKLSSENFETRPGETLDEKEIDDLINRITYSD